MPEIVIIAAVAKNRVIGKDNQLLWNIPEDMAHFKALTAGHTVIMGRKTWESLPPRFRPLPGRRNIVITRQSNFAVPGAETANSLETGIALAKADATIFIIGGGEIYLELTEVDLELDGDAWFPALAPEQWHEAGRRQFDEKSVTGGSFVTYRRALQN